MDHANHSDSTSDFHAKTIEAVDHGVPVPPKIARKFELVGEHSKYIFFPTKISGLEIIHSAAPVFQDAKLPTKHV
jgi:hypothetical protein